MQYENYELMQKSGVQPQRNGHQNSCHCQQGPYSHKQVMLSTLHIKEVSKKMEKMMMLKLIMIVL